MGERDTSHCRDIHPTTIQQLEAAPKSSKNLKEILTRAGRQRGLRLAKKRAAARSGLRPRLTSKVNTA